MLCRKSWWVALSYASNRWFYRQRRACHGLLDPNRDHQGVNKGGQAVFIAELFGEAIEAQSDGGTSYHSYPRNIFATQPIPAHAQEIDLGFKMKPFEPVMITLEGTSSAILKNSRAYHHVGIFCNRTGQGVFLCLVAPSVRFPWVWRSIVGSSSKLDKVCCGGGWRV